jgi:hypothetical protein
MSNISTLPVQNGTVMLSAATLTYIEKYKSFARQTAESIIGLAQTLIEAEEHLDPVDFESFCREVGVPKGSSTYKKLRAIGYRASRFEPFVDNLPNTWTTIYKLAKLEPDEFDRVTPILSPFVTAKAIDEAIGLNAKKMQHSSNSAPDIKISLNSMSVADIVELCEFLSDCKNRYGFQLDLTDTLQQQILKFHKQSLAA